MKRDTVLLVPSRAAGAGERLDAAAREARAVRYRLSLLRVRAFEGQTPMVGFEWWGYAEINGCHEADRVRFLPANR